MPFRGSLCKCVEAAIGRFKRGEGPYLTITHHGAAKYYTLYYEAELEAKAINRPNRTERIVMSCTGGELASIIGTAQMKLGLTELPNADSKAVSLRPQSGHYDPESDC